MVQQQDRGSYSLGPVGVHSHSPGPISCLQMLTGEVTGDVQGPTPPFLRPLMVASLQVRYWLSWTALAGGGAVSEASDSLPTLIPQARSSMVRGRSTNSYQL